MQPGSVGDGDLRGSGEGDGAVELHARTKNAAVTAASERGPIRLGRAITGPHFASSA
jgi:hypothetical protein